MCGQPAKGLLRRGWAQAVRLLEERVDRTPLTPGETQPSPAAGVGSSSQEFHTPAPAAPLSKDPDTREGRTPHRRASSPP